MPFEVSAPPEKRATIGLLGADKQAAVSAALAFPERRFLFVTDEKVMDGWDLPNVTPLAATPSRVEALRHRPATVWFSLCARWCMPAFGPVNGLGSVRLTNVLNRLATSFQDVVLPVATVPLAGARCIVKGDAWHRPDTPLIGDQLGAEEASDPYGCGVVYQEYWPWTRHLLVTGRRWGPDSLELAVIQVNGELCLRDDFLTSGQTVQHQHVAALTIAMLEALEHRGYFTCNWLERGDELKLSSIRPAPRAVFGTLRRAGLECFDDVRPGVRIARAGIKFSIDTHYSSYQPLSA